MTSRLLMSNVIFRGRSSCPTSGGIASTGRSCAPPHCLASSAPKTKRGNGMRLTGMIVIGLLLASPAMASDRTAPGTSDGTEARDGLLPTHVDKASGKILFTLPPAAADGV